MPASYEEVEMQEPAQKVDEFDEVIEIDFTRHVKVLSQTSTGVVLKFLNKPFGFSFADVNGNTAGNGAYVTGYATKSGLAKDMANILPVGYQLKKINGKDVSQEKTTKLKTLLQEQKAPCELHFMRKKLFPDDAVGTITKSQDTLVIEFRFKPFGFAILDRKEEQKGYGAKVKLQKNGSHMNPVLDSILPENSYIMNINGQNVMSLNFDRIGYLLRSAKVPCRIRFGFEKKRYCYKYDYDCKVTPALSYVHREELEVPSESNNPHESFEGVTLCFKNFDADSDKKLGLRLDACDSMSVEEYRKICQEKGVKALSPNNSDPAQERGMVEVGAKVVGHDDPELAGVLPIGSRLMAIDRGFGDLAPNKIKFARTEDIIDMINKAKAPLVLGFIKKVQDKNRPLVMSAENNRMLIQFQQRPFGIDITDLKGGADGYGARVKECKNRSLANKLPENAKIVDINGRRCTSLNFKDICQLIKRANMPAEILFEADEEYNPDAVEFDPETMPVDTQKADGVLVEFVRMPFGHITTMTLKDREIAEELEGMEQDAEISSTVYPKDSIVLPTSTGFKGRVIDFYKRPFGFDIKSIEKVKKKTVSESAKVKALEDRIAKLETMMINGGGKKSVAFEEEDGLDDKPVSTGYGAVIHQIRNDFLNNEVDDMGAILEEGWHLAMISGKDVAFANTKYISKMLETAELPVRLFWTKTESELYPPEVKEEEVRNFEVVRAFKDMSGGKGCTIRFNQRPFGFSIVDENGGYSHVGAAVRKIQNENLAKVLRRFARIVKINSVDMKHANYASICKQLTTGKMPMTVDFLFYHTAEIKNYTVNGGEVKKESSMKVSTFSKCEAMNITFEERPFGIHVWGADRTDRENGKGAQVIKVSKEGLKDIVKKGSMLVSVGHHHVAGMNHQEILKIIKNEPVPCKIGFTYDAIKIAQTEQQRAFSDNNVTMVKTKAGVMVFQVTALPIGIQIKDSDGKKKGVGAVVSGHTNPLVENIIPKGSKIVSVGGVDVQRMNHQHILRLIEKTQLPTLMAFTVNQKVKTKYGYGVLESIREDGTRVVKLAWDAMAYLTADDILPMTEEDEDYFDELEAENVDPEVARPDFLRISTQSNILDIVKRRESQLTSEYFSALNERIAAASGETDVVAVSEYLDEFDEISDLEETPVKQATPRRSAGATRLKASGISNLLTEEEKEDAEEITVVGQGREDWVLYSKLEVYSKKADSWNVGTIINIEFDQEGEWLTVLYELPTEDGSTLRRTKETQRFYDDLRPLRIDLGSSPRVEATTTTAVMDEKVEDTADATIGGRPAKISVANLADMSIDEMEATLAEIEEAEPLTTEISLSPRSQEVGI